MSWNEVLLLDGAMGTMLQKKGLKPGEIPEMLNLTRPEWIREVQEEYLRAGSRIIYANTFGANALKLRKTGHSVREVIGAGVYIAKECAEAHGAKAGLDVGPLGVMLEPLGSLTFEEAYDLYAEMMEAGAAAGVDLIAIETMSDLYETKAALLAAKEKTCLPVYVTMSFEASGRTFTGCSVAAMAHTLEGLGADAIGINCSLGPKEMLPLIRELRAHTRLPIIAKPNAGLPDPVTGEYLVKEAEFREDIAALVTAGAQIAGGCCGTSPDYIRRLREGLPAPGTLPEKIPGMVCTPTRCCETGKVRVIGERINPTGKKRFQQALLEEDLDYIVEIALKQMDAGAEILDVNVGYPGVDEETMLPRVVKAIQAAVELPLQLDSTNPKALEAALRVYNGKPAVNSVNGKEESLETILPLVKKYGAAVVGLTLDDRGMPSSAEERIAIAEKILSRAQAIGIPAEDVWIDCLTLTVSAQQDQAMETLRAVEDVSRRLGLNTVLGVSNISFGLPYRPLITQAFLISALAAGLTLPIVNPNQQEIMDAIAGWRVLKGEDQECRGYIERFANRVPAKTEPAPTAGGEAAAKKTSAEDKAGALTLGTAIGRGLRNEAARLAREALRNGGAMDIVEKDLIPALERVGADYERGRIFLPQLLSAAQAAQAAFEEIRTTMVNRGEKAENRGAVIMATVEGDIHDIGKNIVITVLENYGYRVTDLGRDVPAETIVREAREKRVKLVGLSALMTTTLPAMEKTVRQLKELAEPPMVMVGGAVVTPEYAKEIGADFYAKDVQEAVKISRKVFQN